TVAALEGKLARLIGPVSNPFDPAGARCVVLVDSRGRHSLWPAALPAPTGWRQVYQAGSRADCLDYVAKHWQDGRVNQPEPAAEPAAGLPAGAFPLSFNQEFFCDLGVEAGDAGSFGERHTLVGGWRLTGAVDEAALQQALDDVVERHEILRTSIQHEHEPRYQLVHPPSPASLEVRALAPSAVLSRDYQCEQLLTEIEALAFDVNDLPLVRAVLGRFDNRDAVLVVSLHHIAVDAWSLQVVARDLALCYARRRGFELPLPELHQYREFCVQQRRAAESPNTQPARDYWRTALDGARIFELPTQPPAELAPGASNYAMQSFVISGELSRAIVGYAQQTGTSPYMVMLSAFYLLARELTGGSDLVVPTLTTGRHNVTFHNTVGPFLNFLPIRTDITGCQTFAEVVARTRTNCVQAYSNEIPFECIEPEAPLLFEGVGLTGGTQMSFEMLQAPPAASDELIGDLRYAEIHRRLLFEGDCADLPAGMLWALSVVSPDEIIGAIQFKRSEFSGHAVADLVSAYSRVLRQSVSAPDEPLATFTQQPLTLELDR
ncbi:MAG TPA: condensation domain-containing protein, partial [Jatrophihabitans sp.]|nr:condensation domain-containing protein [Jatrophihabitans sp.]